MISFFLQPLSNPALTVLDWSNTQNGKLIGSIGIISALLQGGYVRRRMSKIGEGKMAKQGVSACALALALLSILPRVVDSRPSLALKLLQSAAVCMAFTSATVVNSLTAFASLQCDEGSKADPDTGKLIEENPQLAKGRALGEFRSSGQLGRALGPLLGKDRRSAVPQSTDILTICLTCAQHAPLIGHLVPPLRTGQQQWL